MAEIVQGTPVFGEQVRPCPLTSDHLDGSRRVSELILTVKHNRRDEMIIWWLSGCVVHERLLAQFEQQGFTGFRVRQATVRFRDGTMSREYRELIVTGWAGIARTESGVRVVESCSACHYKRYSGFTDVEQLIDWEQWTGEDFFMVWPLPLFILVTERVASWLLSHKVKSLTLAGLHDLDPGVVGFGFTVGRLSDFLPEDLALRYGKPLGLE